MSNVIPVPAPAQSLDDLFALHDEPFVKLAYATVLRRTADPDGLRNYAGLLRQGMDRIEVLSQLAASPEGRNTRIGIPGFDAMLVRHRRRPSALRRLCSRIARLLVAPLAQQLRTIENNVHASAHQSERLSGELQASLADVKRAVAQPGQSSSAAPRAASVLAEQLQSAAAGTAVSPTTTILLLRLSAALLQQSHPR